jgi:hypothetical protein
MLNRRDRVDMELSPRKYSQSFAFSLFAEEYQSYGFQARTSSLCSSLDSISASRGFWIAWAMPRPKQILTANKQPHKREGE